MRHDLEHGAVGGGADRDDEAPSDLELLEQRAGNLLRSGGADDGRVGGVFGAPGVPITGDDVGGVARCFEPGARERCRAG